MKKKAWIMLSLLGVIGSMATGCSEASETNSSASQVESVSTEESAADGVEELDLYIDFTWYPSDHWSGIIPEAITEATGVKFNVTRAADAGQLGLMIASGELPDVVFTADSIDRLCDSGMSYGYNELIEQYGVDWTPDSERVSIAKSHNASADDPNYYTILQNYNTQEEWSKFDGGAPCVAGIYYRKDIWEALGSPQMDTIAQIEDVMAMVKENYPDMQVINAGNSGWRLKPFSLWYGSSNDFLYTDDGSVVYHALTPFYYEHMKKMNEFYRMGYYTEENLALTVEADALQQAINGNCFMYEWNARPTNEDEMNTKTQANIPDAEWAYLSIPDDSKDIIFSNSGWAGMFISRNCKNPEAAIKLISYLNSKEGQKLSLWGREGIDYQLDDKGMPQFSEEWKEANKDSAVMTEIYNTNFFCTTEIDELCQYYSGLSDERLAVFTKNSDKVKTHPELGLAIPKSTTDEGIIFAKIKESRDAESVKMWTAPSDEAFEQAYQDYMKLLDKMGVDKLNKYINDSLEKMK